MKRLTSKLVLLLLLIILINSGILVLLPVDQSSYFGADGDKHRILESTPSPRVVFIGGSNLAFSLDSPLVEWSLGVPAVNMGLHANLGLRFMLDEAKPSLRASDIVVIVPEYEHFVGSPVDGTPKEIAAVVTSNRSAIEYLHTPTQYLNLLLGLLQLQEGRVTTALLGQDAGALYSRLGFNGNGDFVAHLTRNSGQIPKILTPSSTPDFNYQAVQLLNEFSEFSSDRSVRAFLAFPAVPTSYFTPHELMVQGVYGRLKSTLEMPMLDSPGDAVYEQECFFDSVYHMTGDCRRRRTETLALAIKRRLDGRMIDAQTERVYSDIQR